ncbi:CaiB/BaiF CoA transferase family protein [Colwellia sp. MEBiC06753]
MSLPLQGLKILDFSTLLPGPYASMILADMGADVLKIESPQRPDMIHDLYPRFKSDNRNTSYANLTLNRNKRSMCLDLKRQPSVEVIYKLIESFDVLIEQFRPGVMDKLGLGFKQLSMINPKLIYCSITGYGQTGAKKDKAGHDINYLALSGLASYSGTAETGPVLSGTQVADIAGGSHQAVMSILAAVIAQNTTGKGQYLDISMTDSAFALNAMFGAGAVGRDSDPALGQTLLNGGCFYDYYKTRDDRYLSVGSLEPKFATQFFNLLGHPEWFELSNSASTDVQQQLKRDIATIIASHPLVHWQAIFDSTDVCVEPVLSVTEAAKSSLMNDRHMVFSVEVDGREVKQIAAPVKFSHSMKTHAAPITGEHTVAVLKGLGYGENQIKELISNE